jgi:hypothetical protein
MMLVAFGMPVIVPRRVIVMVVPCLAASLVADVAVEGPCSAFVCEQRVDDLVDGLERSELSSELAVDLAVDDADANWLAVELQLNAVPALANLDIDSAAAVAAGHHFWRLFALWTLHLCPYFFVLRLAEKRASAAFKWGV